MPPTEQDLIKLQAEVQAIREAERAKVQGPERDR